MKIPVRLSLALLLSAAVSAFAVTLDWQTVQELARTKGAEAQRLIREHRIGILSTTLERRNYWPQIEASSELPRNTESLREELFYNTTDSSYLYQWVRDRTRTTSYGVTVSQELPLGIQLNAAGNEYRRKYSYGGDPTTEEFGVSYTTDVRWQLLSGDPTWRSYRNAASRRKALMEQKSVRERDFELSLLSDFISLLNADGQRKLSQLDADLADSSLSLARKKFNAGLIPQTDLLTIELSALQRFQARAANERSFIATRDQFLNRIGLPPSTEITLAENPALPEFDSTFMVSVDPAKLPEAKIAKLEYDQAKRSANAEIFPLPLQAEARLFQTWDGRAASNADARNNLSESRGGTLGLSWTLLQKNEWSIRRERRKLNLREADATLAEALRETERIVRDAERKLADAREQLVTAGKMLQLSKLRAEMTEGRFATGTISSRELLEAQQDRLQAEQGWLTARGNWTVAALRMQRLKEQCESR